MDAKYRSRRFIIAMIFTITTIVFTAAGILTGSEYLTGLGLIVGLYSGLRAIGNNASGSG